jgi:sensor domain CHASE-containing protein
MLSQAVGLPLSSYLIGSQPAQADFMYAKEHLSVDTPFFTHALNGTVIAGYSMVPDVNGNPLIIARVDDFRTAYAQGKDSMLYTFVSFTVIGLIIFIVIAVYLDKQVISRLTILNSDVINIKKTGDNSKRVD